MSSAPMVGAVDKGKVAAESNFFVGIVALLQVVLFGLMFTQVGYPSAKEEDLNPQFYVMFIDVSIMIFFGFGFLMTFLKRYGLSATGLCMITSCAVVQVSLVLEQYFNTQGGHMNLFTLINGLFCAGAVMISMGAVLGKVTPSQLLLMGICESVFYWINFYIYTQVLGAHDAAGGIVLHAFGCYFGLTVSKFFGPFEDHPANGSVYSSDLFSLAGTFFLWLLWPSFCGAVAAEGTPQFYAVTHTFIALVGSTMGYALVSRLANDSKFDTVGLQNATLAGGVIMGVPCDLALTPAGAMFAGLLAGIVSTYGFLKDSSSGLFGVQDTCGVNNLHGMPGLMSGILGLIVISNVHAQLVGMAVMMGIAVGGGVITAMVMKIAPGVDEGTAFHDAPHFVVADDY